MYKSSKRGLFGKLFLLRCIEFHLYTLKTNDTAEKEVQDTSCRGSGGCPPALKVPQDWGIRGLIKTISALSK